MNELNAKQFHPDIWLGSSRRAENLAPVIQCIQTLSFFFTVGPQHWQMFPVCFRLEGGWRCFIAWAPLNYKCNIHVNTWLAQENNTYDKCEHLFTQASSKQVHMHWISRCSPVFMHFLIKRNKNGFVGLKIWATKAAETEKATAGYSVGETGCFSAASSCRGRHNEGKTCQVFYTWCTFWCDLSSRLRVTRLQHGPLSYTAASMPQITYRPGNVSELLR